MRKYRLVCIVKQSMSAEEAQQQVNTLVEYIEKKNGKVLDSKNMGLEKLAYPIERNALGHYFVVDMELEQAEVSEFRRFIAVNENFLRDMIVTSGKDDKPLSKIKFGDSKIKEKKSSLVMGESAFLNNLSQFRANNGKILPRYVVGLTSHDMRLLRRAMKRSRYMALSPFKARPTN